MTHHHSRSSCFSGYDAGRRVLEYEAFSGAVAEPFGRKQLAVGCGLAVGDVLGVIISGETGKPAASSRRSASRRRADVTTAQRLEGREARKSAFPAWHRCRQRPLFRLA